MKRPEPTLGKSGGGRDVNALKSIVERIESLGEQQRALLTAKRGIYAEAKKAGFDTRALRRIISERRMKDREQIYAKMRDYRSALGMAVNDVEHGASLREAAAKYGISKSTLQRAVPREEEPEMGQPVDDPLDIPEHLRRRREQSTT